MLARYGENSFWYVNHICSNIGHLGDWILSETHEWNIDDSTEESHLSNQIAKRIFCLKDIAAHLAETVPVEHIVVTGNSALHHLMNVIVS